MSSILFCSCEKQFDLNNPNTGEADNQICSLFTNDTVVFEIDEKKYDKVLQASAYAALAHSLDSTLRNTIFDKCLETFDDENNLLLNVYHQEMIEENSSLIALFAEYPEFLNVNPPFNNVEFNDLIRMGVEGFSYFDEQAYTQIYIPFIDNFSGDEIPTVVINFGFNDEVVCGGKMNADGSLFEIEVDENYAKDNLVWVVSINESINSEEKLNEVIVDNSNGVEGENENRNSTPLRNWTQSINRVLIQQIFIRDKKEHWLGGKADVSYASYTFGTHTNPNTFCRVVPNQAQDIPFEKISNNELDRWVAVSAIDVISSSNAPLGAPILRTDEGLFLVFWERDTRKKNERFITHLAPQPGGIPLFRRIPCPNDIISYTSNETPYGITCLMPFVNGIPLSWPGSGFVNPRWNTAMTTTSSSLNGFDSWVLDFGQNSFDLAYTNR